MGFNNLNEKGKELRYRIVITLLLFTTGIGLIVFCDSGTCSNENGWCKLHLGVTFINVIQEIAGACIIGSFVAGASEYFLYTNKGSSDILAQNDKK